MTRKDYVAIAAVLKDARPVQNQGYYGLWCADVQTLDYTAQKLADTLARDNPRFDRARFLKACGVES